MSMRMRSEIMSHCVVNIKIMISINNLCTSQSKNVTSFLAQTNSTQHKIAFLSKRSQPSKVEAFSVPERVTRRPFEL